MKSICLVFVLSTLVFTSKAQDSYRRVSLNPHYSLGMVLPGPIYLESGTEYFQPLLRPVGATGSDEDGNSSRIPIRSTHKWGLSLDYRVNSRVSVRGGFNRIQCYYLYSNTFDYSGSSTERGPNFSNVFKFNSFNLGLKFDIKKYQFVVGAEYMPNTFKLVKSSILDGEKYDFTNSGERIDVTYLDRQSQTYQLNLQFGRQAWLLGESFKWFLSMNYSLKPIAKMKVDFIEDYQSTGTNLAELTANGIFFGLEYGIRFKKKQNSEKEDQKKRKQENALREKEERLAKKEEERKKLAEGKNIEIGDKKIAIGEQLVLNTIQFEQSKEILMPEAIKGLEEVLTMLKKYPSIRIEITGHTSTEGVRSDNIELSKLRAEACKDYLVKKGISAKRIVAFGIGPDRPISNTNQQLNRRVEMKVLEVD
ncbi:MAG: OmpA family protein [Leadbetterella sp.]